MFGFRLHQAFKSSDAKRPSQIRAISWAACKLKATRPPLAQSDSKPTYAHASKSASSHTAKPTAIHAAKPVVFEKFFFKSKSASQTTLTEASTADLKSYVQTQPANIQLKSSNSKFSKMVPPIDALKESIKQKYPSLFYNRIDKMPGEPAHLETDPMVIPIQRKHLTVPYCLIPSTQKKLTYLVMNDIIKAVPEGANVTHVSPIHPV